MFSLKTKIKAKNSKYAKNYHRKPFENFYLINLFIERKQNIVYFIIIRCHFFQLLIILCYTNY